MFKRIVVPLDLTDKHKPVLDAAAELAQKGGGQIYLVHVVGLIPGIPQEEDPEFYRRLERTADKHLQRCTDHLAGKQIAVHKQVSVGVRAQEVARYAEQINADLIALSAPQFDPEKPAAGWASLSWKIGFLAHCPVLLVK